MRSTDDLFSSFLKVLVSWTTKLVLKEGLSGTTSPLGFWNLLKVAANKLTTSASFRLLLLLHWILNLKFTCVQLILVVSFLVGWLDRVRLRCYHRRCCRCQRYVGPWMIIVVIAQWLVLYFWESRSRWYTKNWLVIVCCAVDLHWCSGLSDSLGKHWPFTWAQHRVPWGPILRMAIINLALQLSGPNLRTVFRCLLLNEIAREFFARLQVSTFDWLLLHLRHFLLELALDRLYFLHFLESIKCQ